MPDALPFDKKIVLVTGSGRGIGKAIALNFARQGADLIINFFRNRGPAEQTAAEVRALGRKALVVRANVGETEGIATLFEAIDAAFGGLDILISNAASGYNRPALEQKPKGWDWTLNINARALLFCAQQAVPLMQRRCGGQIVAITRVWEGDLYHDLGAAAARIVRIVRKRRPETKYVGGHRSREPRR